MNPGPSFTHYLLLCAATALWIDFSHVHLTLNADSLLFSISGRHLWTPFFWEQDRIGMFVPLLTSWCPNQLGTLLLQTFISAFMGLAVPVLLVELVYPRPAARIGAVLANALMLALAPERVRANLLFECCYPQAMFLGCTGLLLLGHGDRPRWWRYPAAFACFILAHWVYLGVCIWLLPLAAWSAFVRPGVSIGTIREFVFRQVRYFPGWSSLILAGISVRIGMWFKDMAAAANPKIIPTPTEQVEPEAWGDSWLGFWEWFQQWPGVEYWEWTLAGVAAAGFLLFLLPWFRFRWGWLAACLVLLMAGATEYLFMGTREWPAVNEYHFRYVLGALMCAQTILGITAAAPLARFAEGRRAWLVFAIAATFMPIGAWIQFGLPSPSRPRADLDAMYGGIGREILDSEADAIGGDYWTTWPAYLYLGVLQPDREPPYPIAFRSTVFRPRWEAAHPNGMRVVVPSGSKKDLEEFFAAAVDQGFLLPERTGTFRNLDVYFISPDPAKRVK